MFLFFEPTIVVKTNEKVLQSFSLHWMLINEWLSKGETEFSATLQHWIGGKEVNNIKADILVLQDVA